MSRPGRLQHARLRQHGIARRFNWGHLPWHRNRESQLVARDRIHAHRRAQRGNFEVQLLIQLRDLRSLIFELFHLISKLDAFEVLPGVEQQTRRQRRANGHALPEFANALG